MIIKANNGQLFSDKGFFSIDPALKEEAERIISLINFGCLFFPLRNGRYELVGATNMNNGRVRIWGKNPTEDFRYFRFEYENGKIGHLIDTDTLKISSNITNENINSIENSVKEPPAKFKPVVRIVSKNEKFFKFIK